MINKLGAIVGIKLVSFGCIAGITGFVICVYFLVRCIFIIHKENKEEED